MWIVYTNIIQYIIIHVTVLLHVTFNIIFNYTILFSLTNVILLLFLMFHKYINTKFHVCLIIYPL